MAVYVPQIVDNLNSTSTKDGLSANQGRVLKSQQGKLEDLNTIAKGNLVAAINEVKKVEADISSVLDDVNGEII
jgi:hypothetical protein